ncbi:DUF1080 domain-containing protein [Catenovulum maritimum]|uniref:3-keto-alpha-glucoside-1,2-lyase/3-keto-2-hydroxy-glucal hydratase domain-containing protein n=1 Tax=Catenovulum maritimum TaxID=1513271 RepID=A0A0J8GTP3_9ALTE|nr:DUF1080 domain-containing protein [Catenovulum maritimum]KMT64058.1 hypothetical protein XM47_16480 [Catenovulum maritimum]
MIKVISTLFSASLVLASCSLTQVTRSQTHEWVSLFNGENLAGWQAVYIKNKPEIGEPADLFKVTDGVIHVYPEAEHDTLQPFAAIISEQAYSEYRFSLEYKWGKNKFKPRTELLKDAGLLYHAHGFGKPAWPLSVECQIQDTDTGDTYAIGTKVSAFVDEDSFKPASFGSLEAYHFSGIKGQGKQIEVGQKNKITRIRHSQLLETQDWNRVEIVVRGDQAIHIINGQINKRIFNFKKWDVNLNKWIKLDKGKIVLQAEGAEVFYRNIKIRPLNSTDPI